MARRFKAKGRDISGFILLDKPAGPTSNAVLQEVKSIYFAKKAGHTGSLDPIATGILPICFGQATKLSQFMLDEDKKYRVECRLGVTTNTADREGEILTRQEVAGYSSAKIAKVLQKFTGPLQQTPPMHSAVKHQGQPLYKLAHAGIEVERTPRPIHIYELSLVEIISDEVIVLDIHCSKGTYVRTIVEDIGATLGCGAHVQELQRTGFADFDITEAITLARLHELKNEDDSFAALNAAIKPLDQMLRFMPKIELDVNEKFYISQGQPLRVDSAPQVGMVRMYAKGCFVGVGEILDDGRLAPKRLM